MASGEKFLTGLKAILQIALSTCDMVILNLRQKPMVSHKVPLETIAIYLYVNIFSRASDLLVSILFANDTTL